MGRSLDWASRWGVEDGLIVGATQSSGSTVNSRSATASIAPSACPVTSVADRVVPSVVTIAAGSPGGSGAGSGVVIRPDGYILTNNHIISVGSGQRGSVEMLFSDGQTAPATITGRDPQTDLAVLKVEISRQLTVISPGRHRGEVWSAGCARNPSSVSAGVRPQCSASRRWWWMSGR
jgi:putative serine protease PepD